jgi:hypothetical protein
MCNGSMVLHGAVTTVRVPGNVEDTTRPTPEWVCPDCDYFEDAEEEER